MAASHKPQGQGVIWTIGALLSLAMAVLSVQLYDRFPGFQSYFCGTSAPSGCMEWSLVLAGPLYLGVWILYIAFLVSLTMLPLAVAGLFVLWNNRSQRPKPSALANSVRNEDSHSDA
ncbi:hypothetical protein [Sphingopyxis sp. H115]|uniref:hypothetical protein n=1 Tax=Sphingopyxis sp. H115 TaxID=1759073 RepID=UPI000A950D63|nr:hypothetical protein [Sphingopyxis sp. H115]